MRSDTYKKINRYYWDDGAQQWKRGQFIAQGMQASGHLAYSRLDEDGEEISGEETAYMQIKHCNRLVMIHI